MTGALESGGQASGARRQAADRFTRHAPRLMFAVSRLPHDAPRFTSLDALSAGVIGCLAFMLYLRTLAPGLLGGDSGEFQFAAWLGGFAHPTGYPLYLLLGRLWTHVLPVGDPAWRLNLFSAAWAALAVGVMYCLALQLWLLLARRERPVWPGRLAALSAAALWAVSPTLWSQAVIAEVYTLNAALLAALLLALARWAATARLGWLYAAAALFGLGLAHHRTTILWLPPIVLFAWSVIRQRGLRLSCPDGGALRRQGGLLALLVGLPLLFYAYIPLTATHTPYLHVQVGPEQTLELYTPTVGGFLDYVAGRAFESEFRTIGAAIGRLPTDAGRLPNELTWPGAVAGLIGLGWLARRNRPLLALTGGGFVTLFSFNLFYGIGDIAVYYIPLYLLGALWIAIGVGELAALVSAQVARPSHAGVAFSVCLLVALLPGILATHLLIVNYTRVDQSRNDRARAAWQTILAQEIPSAAILVTNDRDEMMPFWYMQYVEGVRPDLTGLFPLIRPTADWADVGATTESALRSGRPVLLIKPMPGLEVKFRLEPSGALTRVLGPAAGQPAEHLTAVLFADAIRLVGYDARPSFPQPGEPLVVTLYWQPTQRLDADYTTFVQLFNADDVRLGQSDHRPGGVYYGASLWKPGETLADAHTLTLAADLGRPPYTLLVGLYTNGDALRHLGTPQRIGELGR